VSDPRSHPKTADLEALLAALTRAGVEFIVVGGAAAVLHGAPITTQDLDIVHRRTEANVARLVEVLRELDAFVRPALGRLLRPAPEHLSGRGQLNLTTNLGPLDPLCEIGNGEGYDELIGRTDEVSDGELTLRVLDLPTLIRIKAATGRAKDRLILPVLLAVLDERGGG
jgi:hypothetical protein